jgi:hypothetical protein
MQQLILTYLEHLVKHRTTENACCLTKTRRSKGLMAVQTIRLSARLQNLFNCGSVACWCCVMVDHSLVTTVNTTARYPPML